jgi:hypothetical protein
MARLALSAASGTLLGLLSLGGRSLAADVTCYVDSAGGSDAADGKSDTTPVQSVAAIPSGCTIVRFKRGSVFNVPVGSYILPQAKLGQGRINTLANYGDAGQPLPRFVKPHQTSSGGMIQTPGASSAAAGFTIDGLYLSGSRGGTSISTLAQGICVMLGAYATIKNSEITLCDIGLMTYGDNVKVLNNYVHDLSISADAAPGVDPNVVGGAEGIFVNTSHVEVAYNRFVRCSTLAQWVSGTNPQCDGGATEVTVPYAGEVTDVRIHHNLSYYSCGFFEVSSAFSSGSGTYVKGKLTNSVFHDNLMIDSGWISLLQINNTRLTNVRWENNTIVHHRLGADANGTNLDTFVSSAIQAIAFNNTSSGVTGGGQIEPGDIYWTNNLWYFDPKVAPFAPIDGQRASTDQFLKNIVVSGDRYFTTDPGFTDLGAFTNIAAVQLDDPNSYDLVKTSAAVDQGTSNPDVAADVTTDFAGRPRPSGSAYDLGAFEYQGTSPSGGGSGAAGASGAWPRWSGGAAAGCRASSGARAVGLLDDLKREIEAALDLDVRVAGDLDAQERRAPAPREAVHDGVGDRARGDGRERLHADHEIGGVIARGREVGRDLEVRRASEGRERVVRGREGRPLVEVGQRRPCGRKAGGAREPAEQAPDPLLDAQAPSPLGAAPPQQVKQPLSRRRYLDRGPPGLEASGKVGAARPAGQHRKRLADDPRAHGPRPMHARRRRELGSERGEWAGRAREPGPLHRCGEPMSGPRHRCVDDVSRDAGCARGAAGADEDVAEEHAGRQRLP